jgi:hypothetical protein
VLTGLRGGVAAAHPAALGPGLPAWPDPGGAVPPGPGRGAERLAQGARVCNSFASLWGVLVRQVQPGRVACLWALRNPENRAVCCVGAVLQATKAGSW